MSSSVEFVMSRSVKLQHKTLEHVVIRFYIGRLFPKLDENISEIIFPFPFNLIIISSTLALSIKIGYNITCSERIKEGYSKKNRTKFLYHLFDVEIPARVYQVCMNYYDIQFNLYNLLYQQN